MKVDINYVKFLRDEMEKINKVPLKDIEWYDGQRKMDIDPKLIEEWRFVGLSNCSFVELDAYKSGWQEWINNL